MPNASIERREDESRPGEVAHATPGRLASVGVTVEPSTSHALARVEDDDLFTAAEREYGRKVAHHLCDMEGLVALVRGEKLTASDAHAVGLAAKARAQMIANARELGQLVDATDVKIMASRAMQAVRQVLDNLPDKVAAAAISQLGLTQAQQARLREIVGDEARRACGAMVKVME